MGVTMRSSGQSILKHLSAVNAERARRATSPKLAAKVLAIKGYQHRRFAHTYADLLASTRYVATARFFMEELYGPQDFTRRDSQFARVVPALVRLFPKEIVKMVDALAELHALSEALDTRMAIELEDTAVEASSYTTAWQATGGVAERKQQIALTLQVGKALDVLTRNALVRGSLRLMRGPAQAGGMKELHQFLETGFETFKAMDGAAEFLALVKNREQLLVSALFAGDGEGAAQAMSLLP